MAKARNTRTERLCPDCEGAGELTCNDTNPHGYGPDPQCDYGVRCITCAGEGWICWAPLDPLDLLASARQNYLRRFPSAEHAGKWYGEIRQRAVSPLSQPLPHPLIPLYRNVETAIADFLDGQAERDARAALQNHAFVMDHFNRQLGLAA